MTDQAIEMVPMTGRGCQATGELPPTATAWRAALGIALVALAVGCSSSSKPHSRSSPTPLTTSSRSSPHVEPALKLPPVQDLASMPHATSESTAGPGYWLTSANGFVWSADEGSGLEWFDGAGGRRIGILPLDRGLSPGAGDDFCQAMQPAFGSLWLSTCWRPRLLRVDVGSGHVRTRITMPWRLAQEASLAAADGAMWTVTLDGHLVRLDPRTNRVTGRFTLPGAVAVRGGFGDLWVTGGNAVRRVDPATGRVKARIRVGSPTGFLTVGSGSVWVLSSLDARVSRIDPRTNRVVARIHVDDQPFDGGDLAAGAGRIWARVNDALVSEIDPGTNRVTARYGLGSGSGSVAVVHGSVYASVESQNLLWRFPVQR